MGTIFGKLRLLPFALFSLIANIISQVLYLAAYILWFVASYLYPDHPRLQDHWFGFGQFKEQSRVSAIIGTVASILSVIAIAYPIVIIPALWLFFASNIIWSISHYHKLRNPPEFEDDYSANSQTNYIGYTILTTLVSLVTAFCITVSIIYPPISLAMLITSTILALLFTIIGLEYLINSSFSNTPAHKCNGTSYESLSSELSFPNTKSSELLADSKIELHHDIPFYPPLFYKTTSEQSANSTIGLPAPALPLAKPSPTDLSQIEEQYDFPGMAIAPR